MQIWQTAIQVTDVFPEKDAFTKDLQYHYRNAEIRTAQDCFALQCIIRKNSSELMLELTKTDRLLVSLFGASHDYRSGNTSLALLPFFQWMNRNGWIIPFPGNSWNSLIQKQEYPVILLPWHKKRPQFPKQLTAVWLASYFVESKENRGIISAIINRETNENGITILFPDGTKKFRLYESVTDLNAHIFQMLTSWFSRRPPLAEPFSERIRKEQSEKQDADKKEIIKLLELADEEIAAKEQAIRALRQEFSEEQKLRFKAEQAKQHLQERVSALSKTETGILTISKTDEVFPGEIREMVMDALAEYLQSLPEKVGRRYLLLSDLLSKNNFDEACRKRKDAIREACASDDPKTVIKNLNQLGFTEQRKRNHVILRYYDTGFTCPVPISPSDWRSMKNLPSELIQMCL